MRPAGLARLPVGRDRQEGVRDLTEGVELLVGQPDQTPDHDRGDQGREVGHEIARAHGRHVVEEVCDEAADQAFQVGHSPGRECSRHEGAQGRARDR